MRELGAAATVRVDPSAEPAERFRTIWLAAYRHLSATPIELSDDDLAAVADACWRAVSG